MTCATEPPPRPRRVGCLRVHLDSGLDVVIRPIRPEDKPLLAEGFARLSERTAYLRFLGAKHALTTRELRYLTEIDFRDHVAFVAVRADDPAMLVGVARWVRCPGERESAEIAFVVADDSQRQGVGTALMHVLTETARDRGVRRFLGTMLPYNRAAHRLFARISPRSEVRFDDGLHEVRAELAA